MAMLGDHPWQEGVNKHLNPQEKASALCGGFFILEKDKSYYSKYEKNVYIFISSKHTFCSTRIKN